MEGEVEGGLGVGGRGCCCLDASWVSDIGRGVLTDAGVWGTKRRRSRRRWGGGGGGRRREQKQKIFFSFSLRNMSMYEKRRYRAAAKFICISVIATAQASHHQSPLRQRLRQDIQCWGSGLMLLGEGRGQ